MESKNSQRSEDISVGNNIPQSEDDVNSEYSLQSSDEAGKAREKLIRQNKNLRVANMILKQELVQTRLKKWRNSIVKIKNLWYNNFNRLRPGGI